MLRLSSWLLWVNRVGSRRLVTSAVCPRLRTYCGVAANRRFLPEADVELIRHQGEMGAGKRHQGLD